MNILELSIAAAVLASTPILLAAVGELLGEKVGVYNIGIEGVMLVGALTGFVAMMKSSNAEVGLLVAFLAGAAFAGVFAVVTVLLGSDQLVAGLALTLLGIGLTGELGKNYISRRAESTLNDVNIAGLSDLPILGVGLFRHSWLVYVSWVLPFAVYFLLHNTRHGIKVRSVGEDPVAADAAGVRVQAIRFTYVALGGGFMGLGGAYITLGSVQRWSFLITAGSGWIALAVVIFANWRAISLLWASYLVGSLGILSVIAQALGWGIPSQFLSMSPYVAAVLVLAVQGWWNRRNPSFFAGPAGLGQPFMRSAS
jgi:simple sugar transport system permease protein